MNWQALGYSILGLVILAMTFMAVKKMPGMFTADKAYKTAGVLGVLTLALLGLLYVLIALLKQSV